MQRYQHLDREDLIGLLHRAEQALKAAAGDDSQRLVHDLQLHQIELEVQNRDLRAAQAELEEARSRYADLYDFAPVGYLTLDVNGLILNLNLSAAKLLGGERATLEGRPLAGLLAPGSGQDLFEHLRAAFGSGHEHQVTAELALRATGARPAIELRVDSRVYPQPDGGLGCLTTLTDISGLRAAERGLRARNRELSALFDAAPVGIGIVQQRMFRSVSQRLLAMLGYDEKDLLGQGSRKIYVDDAEYERVGRVEHAQIANGDVGEVETLMRRRDGRLIDVLLRSAALDRADPRPDVVFTVLDITERKRTERALAEARRRLDLALSGADIGTYSVRLPGGRCEVDERYLAILGYAPGELSLDWDSWLQMIHPSDRGEVQARAQPVLRGETDDFEAEYRMRHRTGHWRWVLDRATVFERDTETGTLWTAGIHVDVTRRREVEEQLEHLAVHDELTGLLNRRGILRSIERVHSQAQRTGRPYCLAILDLDHFKQVNDAYGHAAGDRVLRSVAETLQGELRRADWVGRWGGEEIVVLLPETTEAQAFATVERLRGAIGARRIDADGQSLQVTASAGLAACSPRQDDIERVLSRADDALYRAKAEGRDRTAFNGDSNSERAVSIAVLIEDALRTAGVIAAYQPIVALASREPVAEEARARIIDHTGATLPATAFLSVAEQLRLMHKIDRLLFAAAVQRLEASGRAAPGPRVEFVNLSADLLRHPSAIAELAMSLPLLRDPGAPAGDGAPPSLVVTISARQVPQDPARVAEALAPLLERGCGLAIADFGGDVCSHRLLTELPVGYVGIDPGVVRLAAESQRAKDMLSSMIRSANELGCTTIAKQIEDEDRLQQVRELGVAWGQGYLLGRPSEPDRRESDSDGSGAGAAGEGGSDSSRS